MSLLGGVTKLIVMMNPSKTWLKPYFETSELFTENEELYEFGELKFNDSKSDDSVADNYKFTYLKQKMNKPELSYKSGEEWDVNDLDEKRNFGTLVHKVLSQLNTKDELDLVIKKMNQKNE